jgi:hypothetical protein
MRLSPAAKIAIDKKASAWFGFYLADKVNPGKRI